jgi:hypothetical protein
VSTKPEAKQVEVQEKTFYVKVINTQRKSYVPKSDAFGKIISTRQGDLRFGIPGRINYISQGFSEWIICKNWSSFGKVRSEAIFIGNRKT